MSHSEIERQNSYIAQNIQNWITSWPIDGKSLSISRSSKGPARSLEVIFQENTCVIVTHLKQKGEIKPLGSGNQAIVKQSLVWQIFDKATKAPIEEYKELKPGLLIADKVPRKDRMQPRHLEAFKREERYSARLASAKHIRRHLAGPSMRTNKSGILLHRTQKTLRDRLRENNPLTQSEKIGIAQDLTGALLELAKAKVVHRDIHIENCSQTTDGRWVVQDLGLARDEGENVNDPFRIGNASLDLLHGYVTDDFTVARASDDAWALGVVLYEVDRGASPDFVHSQHNALLLNDRRSFTLYEAYEDECLEFLEKFSAEPPTLLSKLIRDLFDGKGAEHCHSIARNLQPAVSPIKESESTSDLATGQYFSEDDLQAIFPEK